MYKKEKILILSVGGSPEPLIYSINHLEHDKIIFLHSPQTFHECAEVLNNVESDIFTFKDELSNVVKEYKSEYNNFKKENNIEDYLDFNQISSLSSYDEIKSFLSNNIPTISSDSNISDENIFTAEIPDAESLDDSFRICQDVFSKFKNVEEYSVIVDFTGGTKPMVSGVVLAVVEGNYPNFKFSYVGSKDSESRNKNGAGIVKDGYEITKMLKNPYKKFATLEFNRGKQFFNTYQFKAAFENFSLAEEKTEDEDLEQLASFYKKIVNFYDSWDKFSNDYEDLEKPPEQRKQGSLTRYYKYNIKYYLENDEYISKKIKEDSKFYEKFLENIEFLNLKISTRNRNFEKDIEYYLPDLLNNAQRRIDERKFDDAVARLYRAIELIAQLKLKDLNLLDENELRKQTFFIDKIKLFKESKAKKINIAPVKKWYDYKDSEKKRACHFKLGSLNSYKLLKIFDVDMAKEYLDDDDLFNLVSNRNKSILAHGLVPMTKENADDLFEAVLEYARKYNSNIDDLMELAKFPKLNEN